MSACPEVAGDGLRILIIDHHDSYTLNLLISVAESSNSTSSVVVLAHDHALLSTVDSFRQHLLPHFDAIILGPGPGNPANERDFGPAGRIVSTILEQEIEIPLLGVCLGHQGIALACGGDVIQADSLRHGLISEISLARPSLEDLAFPNIFDGIQRSSSDNLQVIRYNSLTVDETSLPSELFVTAWSHDASCSSLPPVRNDYFPSGSSNAIASSSSSQRVIMGLQHRKLPLWGVQFHPESISSQGGVVLLNQFLHSCNVFWSKKSITKVDDVLNCGRSSFLPTWVQKLGVPLVASSSIKSAPRIRKEKQFQVIVRPLKSLPSYESACTVYERLFKAKEATGSSVWLDSARNNDPQSRFSYMSRPSWHVCYDIKTKTLNLHGGKDTTDSLIASFDLGSPAVGSSNVELVNGLVTPKASRPNSPYSESLKYENGLWTWLSNIQGEMQECLVTSKEANKACPFKTGFVGYFDYEMKVESLKRGRSNRNSDRMPCRQTHIDSSNPSAWFGFCDKMLAFDHQKNEWLSVALIRLNDEEIKGEEAEKIQKALKSKGLQIGLSNLEADVWMSEVEAALVDVVMNGKQESKTVPPALPPLLPSDSSSLYKKKVEAARAYIAQGESYEICLTNQFRGTLSEEEADYKQDYNYRLYQSLRIKNPAPYSAFLDLGFGRSILSTSPERFMNIDENGQVEMRPIKGTLARAGFKAGEEKYRQGKQDGDREASLWCQLEDEKRRKTLQCDVKERAENLMIVDLIRADLLSFCSPESVKVPRLMRVESYESLHQLVTSIIGQKDSSISPVQALQKCFPPGSMTGAPKVRSVDILENLEIQPRGIYSGIMGWIGLNGAASTSVVIRTIVINGRQVSVGAGGAITYLSNAEQEWQEVLDKLLSIANLAK